MDEQTRGYVESSIDKMMKWKIADTIGWLVKETTFIGKDPKEFLLGFWVGRALAIATNIVYISEGLVNEQDKKVIHRMIRRRLLEVLEKIEQELNR